MDQRDPIEDSASESRRRRREGLLIFVLAATFLVLAVLQTQLPELTNSSSLTGNIIFFLLINLNIILLVLFVFLVARNFVKLVVERRQRILGARLRARLLCELRRTAWVFQSAPVSTPVNSNDAGPMYLVLP